MTTVSSYRRIATLIYSNNPRKKNKVIDWGNSVNQWLVTDWDIIRDYLLNSFSYEIQEKIKYTYNEGKDSIFKNLVDYDNIVILPSIGYYYNLRDTSLSYAVLPNVLYTNSVKIIENALKEKNLMDNVPLWNGRPIAIFVPIISTDEKKEYE